MLLVSPLQQNHNYLTSDLLDKKQWGFHTLKWFNTVLYSQPLENGRQSTLDVGEKNQKKKQYRSFLYPMKKINKKKNSFNFHRKWTFLIVRFSEADNYLWSIDTSDHFVYNNSSYIFS